MNKTMNTRRKRDFLRKPIWGVFVCVCVVVLRTELRGIKSMKSWKFFVFGGKRTSKEGSLCCGVVLYQTQRGF